MNYKIYLLIDLYLMYKKAWLPVSIFGLASWLIAKSCWKHYINMLCFYDYIFDNIAHILFGAWVFIGLYVILFKLLLGVKKFQIRNFKLLIMSIIVIFIFTALIDTTNEFTNDKLGIYTQKAYKHDLNNTYFDLIGTGIVILLSLITSTRSAIVYRKRKLLLTINVIRKINQGGKLNAESSALLSAHRHKR